jgi:hypothetical protein
VISARMVRIIRVTCRARSFDDALEYAIGRPHAKTVINPVMAKFREGTSRYKSRSWQFLACRLGSLVHDYQRRGDPSQKSAGRSAIWSERDVL